MTDLVIMLTLMSELIVSGTLSVAWLYYQALCIQYIHVLAVMQISKHFIAQRQREGDGWRETKKNTSAGSIHLMIMKE